MLLRQQLDMVHKPQAILVQQQHTAAIFSATHQIACVVHQWQVALKRPVEQFLLGQRQLGYLRLFQQHLIALNYR